MFPRWVSSRWVAVGVAVMALSSGCEQSRGSDTPSGAETSKKSKDKSKKKSKKKSKSSSKDSPSRSGPGAIDACDLITKKDAESAFGIGVTRGKRKAPSCAWKTEKPPGSVTIDVIDAKAAALAKGSKETVGGVGDDAFWNMKSKKSVVLTAIKGDKAVTISVLFVLGAPPKVTDVPKTAIDLAKGALGKLP